MVCQPLPCDLKYFTTSGLSLMETGTFRGSFWGPRTRFGMSGWVSFTGFILVSMSSESGGDSTSFQSFFEISLGLSFIILSLTFIRFTQTYYTNVLGTKSIHHHMQLLTDETNCHPSFFTVIKAVIDSFKSCIPLEIDRIGKINLVSDKIGKALVFVPFILHRLEYR